MKRQGIPMCVLKQTFQDGHIDFREFMIVLYIMSNGSPEENLKQIFRVFDINNDGTITLKVSYACCYAVQCSPAY
jgi:Ca2+-binding EF-hand superfamily protein